MLGYAYYFGLGVAVDYKKAYRYFKKSADLGYEDAYFSLGSMYEMGCGVRINFKLALDYYLKAAEVDNASALFSIGYAYEFGELGLKADVKQAMEYYQRASGLGVEEAQERLDVLSVNC